MSVGKVYCNSVKKHLGKYFGNWEPIEPIELGNIGYLKGNMFIHEFNIPDLGYMTSDIEVKCNIADQTLGGKRKFQIENNISANAISKGVGTQFKLSFDTKSCVYIYRQLL